MNSLADFGSLLKSEPRAVSRLRGYHGALYCTVNTSHLARLSNYGIFCRRGQPESQRYSCEAKSIAETWSVAPQFVRLKNKSVKTQRDASQTPPVHLKMSLHYRHIAWQPPFPSVWEKAMQRNAMPHPATHRNTTGGNRRQCAKPVPTTRTPSWNHCLGKRPSGSEV